MELDLDRLERPTPARRQAPRDLRPSRSPPRTSRWSSTRTSPAADVEAALREGAGELLESIRLFDVYTGEQVGEGKKSLAYALRFRAADRTLTVEEATAARDAAVALAAASAPEPCCAAPDPPVRTPAGRHGRRAAPPVRTESRSPDATWPVSDLGFGR